MLCSELLDCGGQILADGFAEFRGCPQAILPIEALALDDGDPWCRSRKGDSVCLELFNQIGPQSL